MKVAQQQSRKSSRGVKSTVQEVKQVIKKTKSITKQSKKQLKAEIIIPKNNAKSNNVADVPAKPAKSTTNTAARSTTRSTKPETASKEQTPPPQVKSLKKQKKPTPPSSQEKETTETANDMMSIIEQLSASLKKATSNQKKLPPILASSVAVKEEKSDAKAVQVKGTNTKAQKTKKEDTQNEDKVAEIDLTLEPKKSKRESKRHSNLLLEGDTITSKNSKTNNLSTKSNVITVVQQEVVPVKSQRAIRQRAPIPESPVQKKDITKDVKVEEKITLKKDKVIKIVDQEVKNEGKAQKLTAKQRAAQKIANLKEIEQKDQKLPAEKQQKTDAQIPAVASNEDAKILSPIVSPKKEKKQSKSSKSSSSIDSSKQLPPPQTKQTSKRQPGSSSISNIPDDLSLPVVSANPVPLPKIKKAITKVSKLKKSTEKTPSESRIAPKISASENSTKSIQVTQKDTPPPFVDLVFPGKKPSLKSEIPAIPSVQVPQVKNHSTVSAAPKKQKTTTPQINPTKATTVASKVVSASKPSSIWSSFKPSSQKEDTGKGGSKIIDLKPFDRIFSQLGLSKHIAKQPKGSPLKVSPSQKKIKQQKNKKQTINKENI